MNKNKSLLVLIFVLVVCVAIYAVVLIVSKTNEDTGTGSEEESDTQIDIVNITSPVQISIFNAETEETLNFTKDEDGNWIWPQKTDLTLDKTFFDSIIQTVKDLNGTHEILSPTSGQLKDFGLESPALTAEFTDENGGKTVLRFGAKNSYNNEYYVNVDNSTEKVYLVSEEIYSSFDFDILDAVATDLLPQIKENLLQSVTMSDGEKTVVCTMYTSENNKAGLERFNYEWYISIDGGEEFPIDTSVAENLTALLTGMEFLSCKSVSEEGMEEFGINDSDLTLTVKYTDTAAEDSEDKYSYVVLHLGNTDDNKYYYATLPDSDVVYLLGGGAYYKLFNYTYEELAYTHIANININKIDKLEINDGESNADIVIDRTGGDISYTLNGDDVEYSDFEDFIDVLKSIKASANTKLPEDDEDKDSLPQKDDSVYGKEVLAIDFTFTQAEGLESDFTLSITRFNEEYYLVSFMGRDTQLISTDDTDKLVESFHSLL